MKRSRLDKPESHSASHYTASFATAISGGESCSDLTFTSTLDYTRDSPFGPNVLAGLRIFEESIRLGINEIMQMVFRFGNQTLQDSMRQLGFAIAQQLNETATITNRIESLEAEINSANTCIVQKDADLMTSKKSYEDLQGMFTLFEQDNQRKSCEYENEINQLKRKIKDIHHENELAQKEIALLKLSKDELHNDILALQNENESWKKKVETTQCEISTLKSTYDQAQNMLSDLENDNIKLKNSIEVLKMKNRTMKSNIRDLQDSEARLHVYLEAVKIFQDQPNASSYYPIIQSNGVIGDLSTLVPIWRSKADEDNAGAYRTYRCFKTKKSVTLANSKIIDTLHSIARSLNVEIKPPIHFEIKLAEWTSLPLEDHLNVIAMICSMQFKNSESKPCTVLNGDVIFTVHIEKASHYCVSHFHFEAYEMTRRRAQIPAFTARRAWARSQNILYAST